VSGDKRPVVEGMLERGIVVLFVNLRAPGVTAPESFKKDHHVHGFALSWRTSTSLEVNDWGVRTTQEFVGIPVDCGFPWSSVLGVSAGTSLPTCWPSDDGSEESLYEEVTRRGPLVVVK
jgi:hypothetical protein